MGTRRLNLVTLVRKLFLKMGNQAEV